MYTLYSILVNKCGLDTGGQRLNPQEKTQRERTFCHCLTWWNNSTGSSVHSHHLKIFVLFHTQEAKQANYQCMSFYSKWNNWKITTDVKVFKSINFFSIQLATSVTTSINILSHLFECSMSCTLYALDMAVYCKSMWVGITLCVFQSLCIMVFSYGCPGLTALET